MFIHFFIFFQYLTKSPADSRLTHINTFLLPPDMSHTVTQGPGGLPTPVKRDKMDNIIPKPKTTTQNKNHMSSIDFLFQTFPKTPSKP